MVSLCIGRSVIIFKLSHFLGNNEECASYIVDGIMTSAHPLNLSGEWIVKVEFTVPGVCKSWFDSCTVLRLMRSVHPLPLD